MTAARQSSQAANLAQSELLAELTRRGVTLTAAGDRLQVTAPRGALTAPLRQEISAQKATLLARLLAALATSPGLPGGDGDAAPLPNGAASTATRAVDAALPTWRERDTGGTDRQVPCWGGACAPAPPPAPGAAAWADPRPDLTGDHCRWTVLLALAWTVDGPDPDGVYGALYGVRACGAAITTDVQPLDLTPAGPPLRWRLTRGELPEPEWQAYRARWLWPHRDVLTKLLRGEAGA